MDEIKLGEGSQLFFPLRRTLSYLILSYLSRVCLVGCNPHLLCIFLKLAEDGINVLLVFILVVKSAS